MSPPVRELPYLPKTPIKTEHFIAGGGMPPPYSGAYALRDKSEFINCFYWAIGSDACEMLWNSEKSYRIDLKNEAIFDSIVWILEEKHAIIILYSCLLQQ